MTRKLTKHSRATATGGDQDTGFLSYHGTTVAAWTPEAIILDTGGWFTPTTKERMNQASQQFGLGFSVYQENGQWFAWLRNTDEKIKFEGNRLTLRRRQQTVKPLS